MSDQPSRLHRTPFLTKLERWLALATATLTLIAALLALRTTTLEAQLRQVDADPPGSANPAPSESPNTPTTGSATATTAAGLTYLADLEPAEFEQHEWEEVQSGARTINATTYERSVALINVCTYMKDVRVGYNLNRKFNRFQTIAGVTDTLRSDLRVRFWVSVDDQRLAGYDLKLGQTAPINVEVTGGLRLTLHVQLLAVGNECLQEGEEAVWADARLS